MLGIKCSDRVFKEIRMLEEDKVASVCQECHQAYH